MVEHHDRAKLSSMDEATIEAYDRSPDEYAKEWTSQPPPTDLHELVKEFCRPGPTADIGCGSGRDTAWLVSQGFETVGYDASRGLLAEARRRHPGIDFREGALPRLLAVGERTFENVVCETVIMHLPVEDVGQSVSRMTEILRPGGTIYLSWRVTECRDVRAGDGRLYAAFRPSLVLDALGSALVLHDSESTSPSSGRTVHRLVARKSD